MTITYFAVALNEQRKIAQVLVTREPGQAPQQAFTGVVYKTQREALADLQSLNCAVPA